MNKNLEILKIAEKQLGVTEWKNGSNPLIEKYHLHASKWDNNIQTDDVPWCSSAMCYIVEKVGLKSTDSMRARSWEKWGHPVDSLRSAMPGDTVVFYRVSPWSGKGHVGIYLRHRGYGKDTKILVMGGNQRDEYRLDWYNTKRLLTIRRHDNSYIRNRGTIKDYAKKIANENHWYHMEKKLNFKEKIMDKTYRLFNRGIK